MDRFLYTVLPETVDDVVQAGLRPASQPFPWTQPFFLIDQAINNQLSHLTKGTYREVPMYDLESIVAPQIGELDSMTSSLMMQQPTQSIFGPQSMSQPSHSMSHSSTNYSASLNSGVNAGWKMQPFEEILPFVSGDFNTMMLSSSLQQTAFRPLKYQSQYPPRIARQSARKRAPKTATMSARKWAPAEGRIRQLFLDEERSYKDLMEIVNKEFGFGANERQYKAKIKDMKLKRSVEAKDRIAIVRRVQYRRHAIGKETRHVRVRGHRINQAKLQRWEKEHSMPTLSQPLSPLPSEISLRTRSHLESPALSVLTISKKNLPLAQSATANKNMDTPVTRLLKHLQKLGSTMKSNQSSAIFNEFQQILSFDHENFVKPNHPGSIEDVWTPAIKEDILKVRNWMNLKPEVWLVKEPQEMIPLTRGSNRGLFQSGSQLSPRCGTWRTPYGRVLAVFWQIQNSSEHRSNGEELPAQNSIAAKISICPSNMGSSPFQIVFDLDPRLNPSAIITYHATIPNNSEVFEIIEFGELEELLRALEAKTASLTDRDEEGRSLLNYAKSFNRVEFCRFLLGKNFDPNAIELSEYGYLTEVLRMETRLANEINQDKWHDRSECYRLMLEAGADFGASIDGMPWVWGRYGGFERTVRAECCTTLAYVIHYGQPFVSPNTLVEVSSGKWCSPLIYLAGHIDAASMHCLEKAIILLRWGVAISCRGLNGDNVLHTVLKCCRTYGYHDKMHAHREPGELLKVFIAAGADVYALNSAGESPSRVARNYGRKKEWFKALEFCGFDAREVWKCSMEKNKEYGGPRQTSKASFEEYYQEWERTGKAKWQSRFDEVGSEEEYNEEKYSEEEYSEEEYSEEENSEEEYSEEEEDNEEKKDSVNEGYVQKVTHGSVDEEQGLSSTAFDNIDYDGTDPAEIWKGDPHDIAPQSPDENRVGRWEGMLDESADHTFIQMAQDANNTGISAELYDPMLNDHAETMSGFSAFGDMNYFGFLDRTSVAEGDFSGEMDVNFDDASQTDFGAFMYSN